MSKKNKLTIKDVAKHAGVSITTVSNYLNKNYRNMSTDTRGIVEASIKELGYFPSIGARALSRRRATKSIGIVIPHNIDYTFHHPYFAEVMRGLSSVLENYGYRALLLAGGDRSDTDIGYLKSLSNGIVDGFIFFDIEQKDAYIHEFFQMEIPLMIVGRNPEGERNYVDTDIVKASILATEHLIKNGSRNIFLLTGPRYMVFTGQTIEGYRKALQSAGIQFSLEMVAAGPFSIDFGYETGCSIFKKKLENQAIYSASGQTTLGIMKAAEEFGIKIPRDVQIISFGEHPTVISMFPQIPYIKQPEEQIGQLIGYRLIELIKNENYECESIILPVELVNIERKL